MPLRADPPGDTAPPSKSASALVALMQTDEATWAVPVTPATPTPGIAAAPKTSSAKIAMPSLRDAADAVPAQIEKELPERAVELAKLDSFKPKEERQAEQPEVGGAAATSGGGRSAIRSA